LPFVLLFTRKQVATTFKVWMHFRGYFVEALSQDKCLNLRLISSKFMVQTPFLLTLQPFIKFDTRPFSQSH